MPKVSDEHKAAVRQRILDAALGCLRANGWQDITTRQVLEQAGLSIGTFYNYFPTKDDLYEALARDALDSDLGSFVGSDENQPLALGLLAFLRDYILDQPPGAGAVASFRGRFTAGPEVAKSIRRLNAYVVEQFAPLVERAQAEGWIRDDIDAAALVEFIDMVWDGMARRRTADTFYSSHQQVGETLIAVILGGVLAPGIDAASLG